MRSRTFSSTSEETGPDPFQQVRSYLSDEYPDLNRAEDRAAGLPTGPCRRLLQVLSDDSASRIDLAPLVRHVLRHEVEVTGQDVQLRVPQTDQWPSVNEWKRHGISAIPGPENTLFVEASSWTPDWLSDDDEWAPAAWAFEGKKRSQQSQVLGDPFLSVSGYKTYASEGQKEAVRAVLSAPSGSTLVVNLPTGSGKSQCARLPVLLSDDGAGDMTVVVVPTVSLAMDQEEELQDKFDMPLAYYGGATEANERRRERIQNQIRRGRQPIVFTSPESFCGSLAPAIFQAARRGYLGRLVVDEAHIVDQWGDDFRSSFQELAGVRQGLLREAEKSEELPFQTVLMTATLTESVLDTLESLFGEPGPFEHVSAAQLRPEPSYWYSRCDSAEEKASRAMEALRHLPRPLILYTTERDDVGDWAERLRSEGYERWKTMTGGSSSDHRQEVLRKWRNDQVDLVVATSAFGLGVDKENVRAVVHACLPESIDRYYQEVGRSGRDGKASVSLVAFTNKDVETAATINNKKLISVEKGLERWQAMWGTQTHLQGRRYRVRTDAMREIDMDNDYNRIWNVRTLNLMHRARLIGLDAAPPPKQEEILGEDVSEETLATEQAEKVEDAFEEYRSKRTIEIRTDEDHTERDVWEETIGPLRKDIKRQNRRGFEVMRELVNAPTQTCVAERFQKVYGIEARSDPPREQVVVAPACGGCPSCRQRVKSSTVLSSDPDPSYEEPACPQLPRWAEYDLNVPAELDDLLSGEQIAVVLYCQSDLEDGAQEQIRRFVRWFRRVGPHYAVAPEETLQRWRNDWWGETAPVFLEDPEGREERIPLPEVIFAPDLTDFPKSIVFPPENGFRVLIVPDHARSPFHERRLLRDALDIPMRRLDSIPTKFVL